MRRFARIDPAELDKMKARIVDPVALKTEWVRISDNAESQMQSLADERPDIPIGVAFVDAGGRPRWIGDDAALQIHAPSVRGCWPLVHGVHD